MAITPTGDPAWVRNADHTTYGGHSNKENFLGEGSIDDKTDVDAAEICREAADLASCVWVAEFATIVYTNNDTLATDPTVNSYNAMHGVGVSHAPAPTRNGDGDVYIAWDASYSDDYGVSGDVHIAAVDASVAGTSLAVANWVIDDPDANGKNERVRIRVFDANGAAVKDKKVTVTVWTGVA